MENKHQPKDIAISVTKPSKEYELVDSGQGQKLERFGSVVLSRPDPQALWSKSLPESEWTKADGRFSRNAEEGKWVMKGEKISGEKSWAIEFGGLNFLIKPTAFKHVGLFPEQSTNWDWLRKVISTTKKEGSEIEVLNLFGYTGGATLASAQAGAGVVHVDGSKSAIAWARENADLSGLTDAPVRWILDDARAFVTRELKRGRHYDGIIMDPPAFGHGPESELWKIEDHFLPLVADCMRLLKEKPLFFLINGYSAGYSAIAYQNNLISLQQQHGGSIEIGELAIEETGDQKEGKSGSMPRLLPAGIFARWSAQ